MALTYSWLQNLGGILLLILVSSPVQALKFDLDAFPNEHHHNPYKCIRNFVLKDTLVVVTAKVSGTKGDGQVVDMAIDDTAGNEYGKAKDLAGEHRLVFTPHIDTLFDVCFTNAWADKNYKASGGHRSVELAVDIGADAKDWAAIQATEKLKPIETELRRVEEIIDEIVNDLEYLRDREQKLRDTNESTNSRVKYFGIGTTMLLIALWIWQILYLRAYFRSKHLI